jgi:hypothetical protein
MVRNEGEAMQYNVDNVSAYIEALPDNRKPVIEKLRRIILTNLPAGFSEEMSSGMIGYVVPLSRYPKGYHVQTGLPLPFLALASQKNYVALYHLGLYAVEALEKWFREEYGKRVRSKLDMGRSCIRLKNLADIPYDLIAELCRKTTVDDYIQLYENNRQSQRSTRGTPRQPLERTREVE